MARCCDNWCIFVFLCIYYVSCIFLLFSSCERNQSIDCVWLWDRWWCLRSRRLLGLNIFPDDPLRSNKWQVSLRQTSQRVTTQRALQLRPPCFSLSACHIVSLILFGHQICSKWNQHLWFPAHWWCFCVQQACNCQCTRTHSYTTANNG